MVTLKVSNLCVRLKNKVVLKELSFAAESGVLAVLGPNGCGKTTLLRALGGFIKPSGGEILLDNQPLNTLRAPDIARSIAFVAQEHHPTFAYSVEDMVLMGRTPYIRQFSLPTRADLSIAGTVIEQMGISHLRGRRYTELSGGERRLVLIAMALCQQTKIILLDEPTTFLDMKNSGLILSQIRRVASEAGKTVVVSMHDVNHALECADTALLIYHPEKHEFGDVDRMITQDKLAELYQMDFELGRSPSNRRYVLPLPTS